MIIFLSYAKEDTETVKEIYWKLREAGHQPWMDVHDLLPGQDWQFALQKAISTCDAAIICLSSNSVTKTGYVQVELKEFLEQRKRRPHGSIYLIPVRLDDHCAIPAEMADLHCTDLFDHGGWERVLSSLAEARREQLSLEAHGERRGNFAIRTRLIEEHWGGLPGYSGRLSYPELEGGATTEACDELNYIFRSKQLRTLHWLRGYRYQQEPEFWSDKPYTSTFEAITDYKIVHISDTALSVVFSNYTYEGGAHGMLLFGTYNFGLNPVGRLEQCSFFRVDSDYLQILGDLARTGLKRIAWERSLSGMHESDIFDGDEFARDTLMRGTSPEQISSTEFTFSDQGITLYFPPNQVAPYVFGSFEVLIPHYDLKEILRPNGPHRLFLA